MKKLEYNDNLITYNNNLAEFDDSSVGNTTISFKTNNKILSFTDGGQKKILKYKVPLDYLNFTAEQAGSTIGLVSKNSTATLLYSRDKQTWTELNTTDTITLANVGDKVYFKGSETSATTTNYTQFKMTGLIAGSGSIMSILCDDPNADTIPCNSACVYMFKECTALTTTPSLSATTLTTSCYQWMFQGCTSLISTSSLPAMSAPSSCYFLMFQGCESLITLPKLPAINVLASCYSGMFNGCKNIKISQTPTSEFQTEYRIPTEGNISRAAASYCMQMFYRTGGEYTGAIDFNRVYYTSNQVV